MISNFPSSRDVQYFITVMSLIEKSYIRPPLPSGEAGAGFVHKIVSWLDYIDEYKKMNPEAFAAAEKGYFTKNTTLFITEDGFPITDDDQFYSVVVKPWESSISRKMIEIGKELKLRIGMTAFYKHDDKIFYIKDLANKERILAEHIDKSI